MKSSTKNSGDWQKGNYTTPLCSNGSKTNRMAQTIARRHLRLVHQTCRKILRNQHATGIAPAQSNVVSTISRQTGERHQTIHGNPKTSTHKRRSRHYGTMENLIVLRTRLRTKRRKGNTHSTHATSAADQKWRRMHVPAQRRGVAHETI